MIAGPVDRSRDIRVLTGIAALFGLEIYYAPLAMPILLWLLALAAGWLVWRRGELRLPGDLAALLAVCPFMAWMVLSAFWSLDAAASVLLACRLGAIFMGGAVLGTWLGKLAPQAVLAMLAALAWGLSIAAEMVILDTLANGPLLRLLHPKMVNLATLYSRGADTQALIAVPLAIVLHANRRGRLGALQLGLAILSLLVGTRWSPTLAILLSLGGAALVWWRPWLRWVLPAGLAVAAIAVPFVLPVHPSLAEACHIAGFRGGAMARIYIWNFAAEHIHLKPFFGWGLDAARRMPHGSDEYVLYDCSDNLIGADRYLPLHTHNAILQVWLELGGIGALLGFGALIRLMIRGFVAPGFSGTKAQTVLVAMIVPALSIASVSFGIWQEWWVSALAIALQVAVAAARLTHEPVPA